MICTVLELNLLNDGTANNKSGIYYYMEHLMAGLVARFEVGGVAQCDLSYAVSDITNFQKVGFRWAVNDFSLWLNGTEVATDVSGSIFPATTIDELDLDGELG
jgi:hypothetical protein